jgi:8-oxo-dGTP pyrophosphatase MutT (NUDIX family)
MYPTDLRERLGATLDPDPTPDLPPDTRFASVLLPLVASPQPSLIFTVRSEHLSRHAGEISFPGGLQHEEDANLEATALRETEEELGIPRSAVEVIGALTPVHTFVSGILIVPFVGVLSVRPELSPNAAEIAEVLEYTIEELTAAEGIVEFPRGRHVYRGFAYEMGPNTIWGATAMILHEMLERSDPMRRTEPA